MGVHASLDEYIVSHRKMLESAAAVISRYLLAGQKRVSTSQVAFDIGKRLRLPDVVKEWRVRFILTTAYRMGAFRSYNFYLRRGCGWTLKKKQTNRDAA